MGIAKSKKLESSKKHFCLMKWPNLLRNSPADFVYPCQACPLCVYQRFYAINPLTVKWDSLQTCILTFLCKQPINSKTRLLANEQNAKIRTADHRVMKYIIGRFNLDELVLFSIKKTECLKCDRWSFSTGTQFDIFYFGWKQTTATDK